LSICESQRIQVDPKTNLLIDEFGRYRIYHGVNVVYKDSPFYPPNLDSFEAVTSFCEEDAKNLKMWGFNILRLYMSWEGVEPERGNYNTSYLE
jgi:endoglycosylceramidase